MGDWTVIGSITLAAVPESVGEARRFAAETLPEGDRRDTVELLVSEACTNSVQHSRSRFGGKFTFVLSESGGAVRCEVVDEGSATLPTRRKGGELRGSGYGVMLIETLADRSGHFFDGDRLYTWFELD